MNRESSTDDWECVRSEWELSVERTAAMQHLRIVGATIEFLEIQHRWLSASVQSKSSNFKTSSWIAGFQEI